MTHFLDTLPLDFAQPGTRELRDLLANIYYDQQKVVDLLHSAEGIGPANVALGGSAYQIWNHLLSTARNRGAQWKVLNAVLQDPDASAYRDRLAELGQENPVVAAEPTTDGDASTPELVEWAGPSDAEGIERLLGKSTFLDVAFLAGGLRVAPAVGRFRVRFGNRWYHGSGFRIGTRHLLTNHHVLFDWERDDQKADEAEIWFDYETGPDGNPRRVVAVACDVATIVGKKRHDWAVIEVEDEIPADYPVLSLADPTEPLVVDDRVSIIQHPNGGPKKIGLHRNVVSLVDDNVVQYLTDTEGGSSGSPVFNHRWEVVALHHRWVEVARADGSGIDFRNQGRRIERVRAGIEAVGIELVP